MNRKAQAGLEYLITYGWAIVLVVTVLSAIVLIVTPTTENTTFNSSDPTKLIVKGATIGNGQATIKLQNITGGKIKNIQISENPNYEECTTVQITAIAGGEIELTCNVVGQPWGSIDITFQDQTELQQTVTISGGKPKTQQTTETNCTDQLDNDFDGKIDTEDTDCSHIEIIESCPANLNQENKTYILNSDLSSTGTCITFNTNNITLNCDGHSITGNGTGDGVNLNKKINDTVENCTISNFERAIYTGYGLADNVIIRNNILTENRIGFYCIYIGNFEITGNSVSHNTVTGISSFQSGPAMIKNNTVNNNRDGMDFRITGGEISNNTTNNNTRNGFFNGSWMELTNHTSCGNGSYDFACQWDIEIPAGNTASTADKCNIEKVTPCPP